MQKYHPLKKPKFWCVSTWHFMLSWNVCVFQSFSEGRVEQSILSFFFPLLSACSKLLSKWQIHQATLRLCHKCANAVGVARKGHYVLCPKFLRAPQVFDATYRVLKLNVSTLYWLGGRGVNQKRKMGKQCIFQRYNSKLFRKRKSL